MRALFLVVGLLVSSRAHAQPAEEGGAPPASTIEASDPDAGVRDAALDAAPPALLSTVDAPYPDAAKLARVEGRVLLLLEIAADGSVAAAEVLEGPGHGLDEAARDAVLRFRFEPARAGGVARAARIRFAYDFKLPAEPAPVIEPAPIPPAPMPAVEVQAEPATVIEVSVIGERESRRLERSANAVTVVELERARRESSDLGQVLARAQGVSVQRMGGLGTEGRLSLGGFDEGQVRVFVDGIPIELAGYPFGLQNVPIDLAERVDIYKGVVPVRLSADALGGAFDVVTDHDTAGSRAQASYQGGSFDTHRLAASARHLDAPSGLFSKAESFYDATQNDYEVDADTQGPMGEVVPATVYRFNDAYRALGGNVETGWVDRPWAQRLLVRGFLTSFDKELQHNATMTDPYGEAAYGGLSAGGSVRYQQYFGRGLRGTFVAGYAFNRADWQDLSACVYDWLGRCIFERRVGGEVTGDASDRSLWAHTGYGRFNLAWTPHRQHLLRLAAAPTYFTRRGEERALGDGVLDRLGGERELLTWVSGVEYETRQLSERLQNIAFIKSYVHSAFAHQPIAGAFALDLDTGGAHFGAGNGLRYTLVEGLFAKASYEYAIRLPDADELFGNGGSISENLEIVPERSHNANLGLTLQALEVGFGTLDGSTTGFFRQARELIVLLGRDSLFQHRNVGEARIFGVEAALSWLSPGEHVELAANGTYQDARNVSTTGAFAGAEQGDRLPNRPYLFANGSVRLQHKRFAHEHDALSLTFYLRYTHEFFKNWESVGSAETKATVDAQLIQTLVLAYVTTGPQQEQLSFSCELQNVTDEKAFDFFGAQRPGRAFYAKIAGAF